MSCLMNVILKVVKGCRGVNTKLEEQIDQVLIRYIIQLSAQGFHEFNVIIFKLLFIVVFALSVGGLEF